MRATCVNKEVAIADQHATAAADADVVITIPAAEHQCAVLARVSASYSEAPSGGRLTVVCGSTTIFDVDIPGTDFERLFYTDCSNPGLHNSGTANEAMVITLHGAGASCVGKLNVGIA